MRGREAADCVQTRSPLPSQFYFRKPKPGNVEKVLIFERRIHHVCNPPLA